MPKFTYLLLIAIVTSAPLYAKDKNSSTEDAIRDEIRDSIYDEGKKNKKGHARTDNPGEHCSDKAAQKQRENPGKGSKGDDTWEDRLHDAVDDDDKHDKDKDKDKDKKKDKNKKNK